MLLAGNNQQEINMDATKRYEITQPTFGFTVGDKVKLETHKGELIRGEKIPTMVMVSKPGRGGALFVQESVLCEV